MLNDIQKAFIKKHQRKSYAEKDLMLECAQDFGRLIASGEKDGLSIPVAFEAAKNHFKIYGKAMMEFADLVTIEMMPTPKKSGQDTESGMGSAHDGRGGSGVATLNPPAQVSNQVCAAPPGLTKEMLKNYKPDPANFGEPWHRCACGAMFHLKDSPSGVCPNCRDNQSEHQEGDGK